MAQTCEKARKHGVWRGLGAEQTGKLGNDETGAVTIRYSEPEGFPFKFHWETTVDIDGHATSTEIEVEEPIA